MSITKGITDGIFRRYFPESVIWRFSEKIQLIYNFHLNITDGIIIVGGF
jgi:hypothetical protein